jgi:hypothetical protein
VFSDSPRASARTLQSRGHAREILKRREETWWARDSDRNLVYAPTWADPSIRNNNPDRRIPGTREDMRRTSTVALKDGKVAGWQILKTLSGACGPPRVVGT